MLTCKEISALATDYTEGHLATADRERFESHLAGCSGCSAWVKQLAATARIVGALPEPELPLALRQELLATFDDWARRRAGAPSAVPGPAETASGGLGWVPAVAALGSFGVLVAAARHPSHQPGDWGLALALAGVAAALALLRRRLTVGVAAASVAAAAGAALLAGGQGPLESADALPCVASVGMAAAAVAGVTWLVMRRGAEALWSQAGAWAVAGGLAGVGALQVTCGAHTSLMHLVSFHVGSLLAVAAIALLVPRLRPRVA